MRLFKTIASIALLALPLSALGWGQKGHDTVVEIASRHFTDRTRAAVDSIFDGLSPIYWANWLDNASHTPEYDYSKTWHYKNIDADKTYESAPLNAKGDIVRAINEQAAALASGKLSKKESALALKMIIHFLGDLHQPMHMGRYSDLGGNKCKVKFFDRDTNLHSVWDTSLPEAAHKWSYTEWADQIDREAIVPEVVVATGDAEAWAKETYEICKDVYNATPEGTVISYDYIARWTPVIEQQFRKGGLRLAYLLNSIFDAEAGK